MPTEPPTVMPTESMTPTLSPTVQPTLSPNEHLCFNTDSGPNSVDDGCDGSASPGPFCVGKFYQEVDAHCYGEYCVLCLNTQPSDNYAGDWGCSGTTPRCVLENVNSPGVWKDSMKCAPIIGLLARIQSTTTVGVRVTRTVTKLTDPFALDPTAPIPQERSASCVLTPWERTTKVLGGLMKAVLVPIPVVQMETAATRHFLPQE
jgi:hypothetical protein